MHTFALIPFVAVLVSSAFAAVSIAWDSERRATRSMGAIFLCTGLWALVDLLTYMESDPDRALMWMRWSHLPALLIGPSALWVTAQMFPQSGARLARHARVGAFVCLGLGVVAALVPGSIEGMVRSEFGGWMPRYGILSVVLIPAGLVLPVYAAFEASRIQGRLRHSRIDQRRAWALRVCVAFSILVAMPTELVLPLAGIPVPRLGAFAVTCAAAVTWLRVLYEADDLTSTPQGVARALIAKLHDGVVLVRSDGSILSTNMRFAQMSGRMGSDMVGDSLGSMIDAPIEKVCAGLEDRESALREVDGVSIPVSMSSSIVRNRSGGVIGVVVVFRDLREIDALRNQLLTSGRLAAIGELAAGIAHEVNNPVAFIRSGINLLSERIVELRGRVVQQGHLEDEVVLFDRGRRRVENALEGIERVAEVVGDVREFAHVGGAGQGGSDPEAVVNGAMRLARLQRGDEVELRISSVDCSERIDSGQELKQVLLALMRVMVDGAEKGAQLNVDLRVEAQDLVIGISVEPLVDSSAGMLARFDVLGDQALDGSHAEFGLGVAAELIEQLGGGLTVEATGPHELRLEVSVPLVVQGRAS